jgi:hypothetical protein
MVTSTTLRGFQVAGFFSSLPAGRQPHTTADRTTRNKKLLAGKRATLGSISEDCYKERSLRARRKLRYPVLGNRNPEVTVSEMEVARCSS